MNQSSIPVGRSRFAEKVRRQLVELWRDHGDSLLYSDRCRGLLKDLCPQYRAEVFALSSVAREGLLPREAPSDNAEGTVSFLTSVFQNDLGLSFPLARWVAETWALARGWVQLDDIASSFPCPSCNREGVADASWRGKAAICPGCKSQLEFDDRLVLLRVLKGHDLPNASTATEWVVLEKAESDNSSTAKKLRGPIQRILQDPQVSPAKKAELLDLRRIVAVLEAESREVLDQTSGLDTNSTSPANLISTLLRGVKESIPGLLLIDPPFSDSVERLVSLAELPPKEKPLGLIEFPAFDEFAGGMVFTDSALYFLPTERFAGDRVRHRIELRTLSDCAASPSRLHEITCGTGGPTLSTKNTGVSRSAAVLLFRLLGRLAASLASPRD